MELQQRISDSSHKAVNFCILECLLEIFLRARGEPPFVFPTTIPEARAELKRDPPRRQRIVMGTTLKT
jgi:hypothetical protein